MGSYDVTTPLKTHGGKRYLAKKIVALFPDHLHYVEPYAGGLSVLLAKDPEGISEVVNDLDGALMNFWAVLKSQATFQAFQRILEATPFSEIEYACAKNVLQRQGWDLFGTEENPEGVVTDLVHACRFFIVCRQSLAGRMDSFAPLSRNRTRRGMNEQASAWLTAIEGLPAVHNRLKRVVILNRDALDVIRQQDGKHTCFYCDPPYLKSTRASPDVYAHEMTEAQHETLLALLGTIKGKFLLSGYRSALYDTAAEKSNWKRHDFSVPNNAAGGDTKRTMVESVWMNF